MKNLLLVDDNGSYANLLSEYFEKHGFSITWAKSAKEAIEQYNSAEQSKFCCIVTDITMEGQISGLLMLRKIRSLGFQGQMIVASTGFDVPMGKFFTRLFFKSTRIDYLIPKKSVLSNQFKFFSMEHFSAPISSPQFING